MGKERPPEEDGNTSDNQDAPDGKQSVTTPTGDQPETSPETTGTIPKEPRTPTKETPPATAPTHSTSGRKYRSLYENMKQRLMGLQKSFDEKTAMHEKILGEKNKTFEELDARLDQQSKPCVVKMCNEDIFVPKLKKNVKGPTNGCEV